ncbi:MAG: hypothetical protein QOI10_2022 [Solirubrobacterales bacterium]|jgi:hypothetical protein|nr:hypothetical protein [Solirubrobacterales bacterium]
MQFVLSHRHAPKDCGVAFAAWRGFDSPLRHHSALASCPSYSAADSGEHLLIWTVEANSEADALALLPPWLAKRAEVRRVGEVAIP